MAIRFRIISAMQRIARSQQVALRSLENRPGIDPFTVSDAAAFPLTTGDFVRACENVPA
jgi:hypothetical protein